MSSENERNEFRQNQTVPQIVLYAQLWGGVYFCTEWVEEKKRRKSLWDVGLSKAGAGKKLAPAFALV